MKENDETNFDITQCPKKILEVSEITINIEKYCRICFEQDDKHYIIPCICSGSMEYVHEDCLKNWIIGKYSDFNSAKCEVCKSSFNLTAVKSYSCKCKCTQTDCVSLIYRLSLYLIILTILSIVSFISFTRFLDFEKAFGQSIAIVCVFSFFLFVNLFIVLRVVITNCLSKKVVSVKILNRK